MTVAGEYRERPNDRVARRRRFAAAALTLATGLRRGRPPPRRALRRPVPRQPPRSRLGNPLHRPLRPHGRRPVPPDISDLAPPLPDARRVGRRRPRRHPAVRGRRRLGQQAGGPGQGHRRPPPRRLRRPGRGGVAEDAGRRRLRLPHRPARRRPQVGLVRYDVQPRPRRVPRRRSRPPHRPADGGSCRPASSTTRPRPTCRRSCPPASARGCTSACSSTAGRCAGRSGPTAAAVRSATCAAPAAGGSASR